MCGEWGGGGVFTYQSVHHFAKSVLGTNGIILL